MASHLSRLHTRSLWASALTMLAGLVTSWMGFLGSAQAQGTATPIDGPRAVLELFTSQGCSSCPPADALLQSYAAKGDLVALTFPVDYWDYLGWKDTLASPKFSARQRYYAKSRGDGRIYTPQLVINGVAHTNGASSKEVDAAIEAHAGVFAKIRVPVQIKLEGSQLLIETGAAPNGATEKDADIWLLMLKREVEVPIKSGENHGKMLKYVNVVRDVTAVGMWSGQAATIRLNRDSIMQPGADACAVLIQSGKAGPLLGGAFLGKL